MRLQLGVLVSGSGSNLQAILDAAAAGNLAADIRAVISNRPEVLALTRAERAGVPAAVVSHRGVASREAFEDELIRVLRAHGVEWVALAGFMRVLTPHFLRTFAGRVVNIHPALLPAFPGTHAVQQALAYGVRFSGCTVHFVDEGTDTGPIIAQAVVPVLDSDDEATLAARILEQEHRLYPWVLQLLATDRVVCEGRKVRILGGQTVPSAQLNPAPEGQPRGAIACHPRRS